MLAKDIEVNHVTWNVQLFVATDYWLWKFYRRFYAIHQKRPKAFGAAYRKGCRLVGSLWGLVVGEDRSDYHPYLSSTVWITRCLKIKQPTYSRDKSPASLLLANSTLRWLMGRKENSEAYRALYILPLTYTYISTSPGNDAEIRDFRERLVKAVQHCFLVCQTFKDQISTIPFIRLFINLKPHSLHPPPAPCSTPSSSCIRHSVRQCTHPPIKRKTHLQNIEGVLKGWKTNADLHNRPPTSQILPPILRLYKYPPRN